MIRISQPTVIKTSATNLHASTAMASNEKTSSSPIARISNKIDFYYAIHAFGVHHILT